MNSRVSAHPAWRRIAVVYIGVQFAEIFGVSMIYAYLPLALEGVGVPLKEIPSLAGVSTAGLFIIGAPQVPIWLALAELRSRRLVVVRSGIIALAALVAFALAREAWQLIAGTIALGFWLGNTGVMLATIREVAPVRARPGLIALFSAAAPMGFAAGPLLAAWMMGGLGLTLAAPVLVAAAVNALLIIANIVAIPDVRPLVQPRGTILAVARRSLSNVFRDPVIRAGYLVLSFAIAGERMLRPVLPLRIAEVLIGPTVGSLAEPLSAPGVAGAVGLLTGLSALLGALAAPAIALLAPRIGMPHTMAVGFLAGATAVASMMLVPTLPLLALLNGVLAASAALLQAMVFSWLSESVVESRRSAALSLALFPLYAGAVVGPILTAIAAPIGVASPGDELALAPVFVASSVILALGILVARRLRTKKAR